MNGVPVVSLNVDPDKIISNYQLGRVVGENGTSIKLPHNHKEMAKKLMTYIEVILEDNNIYQRMCRNSYKYVIQYHAPDHVVPKLIEVLEREVSYSL
jgi:glycosyltransferase involved in cell wall biosynthesis